MPSLNMPVQPFYFTRPIARSASQSSTSSSSSSSSPSYSPASSVYGDDVASSKKCNRGCKCFKCQIGDFVFESEQEYRDYLEIVEAASQEMSKG